jgi:S-adenosyl methyltransferase
VRYRPAWAPDEVDIERPAPARMYDYYLGGSHNFAADRALAEETVRAWPGLRQVVQANRAFLRRAVEHLAAEGARQFLDLGSGIPTANNVHEVAYAAHPDSRTVYVDSDPVAVAHSSALLADTPHAAVVHADMRDPEAVLRDPAVDGFLDLSEPVAVLMFAVLPFVAEADDPDAIVAGYRDATAPGSFLAISHGTGEYRPDEAAAAADVYTRASHQIVLRPRARIRELMSGYELLPPGLVDMILWRPDPQPGEPDPRTEDVTRYSMLAAVGRRG